MFKYNAQLTIAYASYKALKAIQTISKLSSNDHEILKDSSKLQAPKQNISPQYFVNPKGLWIYHRDWILPQAASNLGLTQPVELFYPCTKKKNGITQ